jgi:tetratricopeptide (TPR) repeat protein
MIVKNEAAFLEGCLSSLHGNVDEIVIVDTGSDDESMAIARTFDCILLQQEWRHDFSAARNTAIENASGDWILYIDADEILGCPDGATLKQLLPGPETAAARVRFQPRSDMTSYGEMRLFRRDPRIRFQGSMHETTMPAVELVCREDGLCISQQYQVSLVHLGYDGDQSHKHERNLPLLNAAIETNPTRVYLRYHLGFTLLALGRTQEAAVQLREGMRMANRDSASAQARVEGTMCAQILAGIELEDGRPHVALETVNAGHSLVSDNLALRWLEARCLVALKQFQHALALLEPITAVDAETFFDERIAYEKSLFQEDVHGLIGVARFHGADYAGAYESYQTALGFAPDSIELRVKQALCEARAAGSVVDKNT